MGHAWMGHPSWEVAGEASEIAGRALTGLLLDAPMEELTRTANAQLATFVMSLVVLDAVERLGLTPAACCMAPPRSMTRDVPSASERAPVATRAVYSPRLWPAQAAGVSPNRSTASSTTRLITKVASWALAVRVSSSIGASRSSPVRSRPAISEASPATSHEGWSTQACPMPDRWDPCPGKVKASTHKLLSPLVH